MVRCPACQAADLQVCFEWRGVPAHQNLLLPTRPEALGCGRGDIVLGVCPACQFVSNTAFSQSVMRYAPGYDASQGRSPYFRAYLERLVSYLVERWGLTGKQVIEIGCGQGEFLRLLCERGKNHGVGFDPSYAENGARPPGTVQVIRDVYSERYAGYRADCICCRHTLEHIPDPRAFVQTVRRAIGPRQDTVVYFEIPSIEWIFATEAIWAVTYEHCSWFSPTSIARLFEAQGFDVVRVTEAFDGEYLWVEALPHRGDALRDCSPVSNRLTDLSSAAAQFAKRVPERLGLLRRQFDDVRRRAPRCVLWGAAGKGVTWLNALEVRLEELECVIDLNPAKEGRYIPGTGQRVVSLASMTDYRPEAVLVTNALYLEEMRAMLAGVGLHPELVLVQ